MALLEKHLYIKKSNIPGAGKGLFTLQFITKGTVIVEYKGRITTWKEVLSGKVFNSYVYYLNRRHVIDAMPYKKALARFANDANGLNKIENLKNNSKFIIQQNKVYIQVVKDICAGEEILVSYGREYWKVIAENNLTSK
ncbi:MAG TPA: SET domain-containing protein-lysine N-methyltransferase [Hanamia sp.]|nr:SET domain-containing protein-lysine N-methyltransferase [Hanamia sp.]